MRKRVCDKLHRLVALIVLLVVCITVVLGVNYSTAAVYAATYVGENDYDSTSVLDDLDGAVINGTEFNILDFAFNAKEETQVIAFTEYCYSYYANQQDNYALYVYVWNPQGLDIAYNSTLNKISLRFGADEDTEYSKYPLYYCSRTGGDYEGLIYKFKVYLTSAQKEVIFDTLNSLERKYWVSEVELKTEGDSGATAYYVSTSYTYTGFAANYGANNSTESTLACVTQQEDTLTLNCGTAYYRPEGTNGEDLYTQDNLSSVYFAVPNSYLEKYGYLCALSAEWYEAMLYPMLVTASDTAYGNLCNSTDGYANGSLLDYRGVDITDICESDEYFQRAFIGGSVDFAFDSNTYLDTVTFDSKYSYGISNYVFQSGLTKYSTIAGSIENTLSTLYSVFLKEDYVSDSGVEVVSTEEILEELERSTEANYASYDLVAGKYASYLFESYSTTPTEFHVDMRETEDGYENAYLDLTSQLISYNGWWKSLWGDAYTTTTNIFEGIPALQALTDEDFSSDNEDSVNAQALYVSEPDYVDLKEYYDKWTAKTTYTDASGNTYDTDGYTIYICRFDVGEYISAEAKMFRKAKYGTTQVWDQADSNYANNFFFQETVYLDFDIIDVTFTNGKTDTTIGVVMSPIDIVYEATSPVYTTSDTGCSDITDSILLLLSVLLLVILIIIFFPVLKYVIKFVVWVICLPFKLIGKIISSVSKNKDKKNNRKNE